MGLGHLNSNRIKDDIVTVLPQATDKLTESFMKLGNATELVGMNPNQETNIPMETETMTDALHIAESGSSQLDVVGLTLIDDTEKDMMNEVLKDLHLDSQGDKDRLHKDDMFKYAGSNKFNSKSFKSGHSVGYIDLNAISKDVLFAQIRILRELMFSVIPLSRYNHLVGNGGLKVWSKRTAQTAVPLKKNMGCPMSRPNFPG